MRCWHSAVLWFGGGCCASYLCGLTLMILVICRLVAAWWLVGFARLRRLTVGFAGCFSCGFSLVELMIGFCVGVIQVCGDCVMWLV